MCKLRFFYIPSEHYHSASDIFAVDMLNIFHKASGLYCVLPVYCI